MSGATEPIIAVVGNVTTSENALGAAEALGRELAKAGFRILVYSSDDGFLEKPIVRGYVASKVASKHSIQVRYPLHSNKPSFPEQQVNPELFEWRPDRSPNWTMSFYQSLSDVDGILLMGGGNSALIAGLVAMGHRMSILALGGFGGDACKIWESLLPGRDLPTADEISLMARPNWTDNEAAECVKALRDQLARKAAAERLRQLEAMQRETRISRHGIFALLMFLLAVATIITAWTLPLSLRLAVPLLFLSPLFAGVAGSTVRLLFDLRQGTPFTMQSTVTTAALGLIAGGVAGLLFVTAQVTTAAPTGQLGEIVSPDQARKLVPFGVLIGFVAGLTLDAVFRKLIASDVVDVSAIEVKKRP